MTLTEHFEALKGAIFAAADDVEKAEKGNGAAGTRVRKAMQEVKNEAKALRDAVLEVRKEKSSEKAGG